MLVWYREPLACMMTFRILLRPFLVLAVGLGTTSLARSAEEPSLDELFEKGKELFDRYAPEEVKEQYEFPSKEQWDAFAARLQGALDSNDVAELATHETDARNALAALRLFPGYEDYADWLQERIDYIEAAKELEARPPTPPTPPTPVVPPVRAEPKPVTPRPVAVTPPDRLIPHYNLWLERIRTRPLPRQAGSLMPKLRAAFAAEGLPAELAWIAETESTLNPAARSPAGAKGLFQLMPETAKSLGLSVYLPDERSHVEKSAQAAAKYLKALHGKFGSWPLALAAYNAGEGRVRRLMKSSGGSTFAAIAAALPSETRMYVPKVCATIAVRAGVAPDQLAAPTG